MQILRYIFEHPYWVFSNVSKDPNNIPEFVKCNSTQLPKLFEFINKFIDEFGDDTTNTKSRYMYGTIFNGLAILARAGIKSMIESKTCGENTSFPSNILITALKLKEFGMTVCSQQDLQLIARHTEIDESEYIEHSDILSPYFKLLNKRNNLKTDTVKLLHEISGAQTTVNITKNKRIQNNKGNFSLYGKSYTLNDIESCPTAFDWDKFILDDTGKCNASKSFKEMSKKISVSDALEICKYSYVYNKEYNYIFPQLKNSLISELNESQIISDNLSLPAGKILENEFTVKNYWYTHNKFIYMLNMLLDNNAYDEEYIKKLILLLIYHVSGLQHNRVYIKNNKEITAYLSPSKGDTEFNSNDAEKYLERLYYKIKKYSSERIVSTLKDIISNFNAERNSYMMLWIVASLKLNLEK